MIAALAIAPAPAPASEALWLAWEECRTGSGLPDQTFTCGDNTMSLDLVVSFQAPLTLDDVVGLEAIVDVQHSGAALPDWWRMEPGGCRAGELLASADFSTFADCNDPWVGLAGAEIQSFLPGEPHGSPAQARIRAVAGLLQKNAVTLDGALVYYALRIRFRTGRTTGTGECPGCVPAACLVLNGITLRRLSSPDVVIATPSAGNGNWVTWRGGAGAACATVPARAVTWGHVKALYR